MENTDKNVLSPKIVLKFCFFWGANMHGLFYPFSVRVDDFSVRLLVYEVTHNQNCPVSEGNYFSEPSLSKTT